jgi:hypothetical protein
MPGKCCGVQTGKKLALGYNIWGKITEETRV